MLIAIIVISVIIAIGFVIYSVNKAKLKKFAEHNLIVFGEKGSGKSLLFSCIAKLAPFGYISNTDFGFNKPHYKIKPSDIKCGDNTAQDFLLDTVKPFEKQPQWERKAVLLDDAGIYLPSWEDTLLKKTYKGMPAAFAGWRHFYDAPIHINAQANDRVWKLLREQQGRYIHCKHTFKLPFGFFLITATGYTKEASASQELEPMSTAMLNKYQNANAVQYGATNGKIEKMFILGKFSHHHYDSRYFHKVCFGEPAPSIKQFKRCYRYEKKLFKSHK